MSPREFVGYIGFVDVLFVGLAAWVFVRVTTDFAGGWLLVLGGLPAWLAVRALFFTLRGSETGVVTVDHAGVVHVLSGRRSVRRLQRMFDDGAAGWMRASIVGGLTLFLGGLAALVAVAIGFDTPLPFVIFLTGSMWACLDLVRWTYVLLVVPWRRRQQRLDAGAMLPLLALYARHHGWAAAVGGVPADVLFRVLASHPDDARQLREYMAAHRLLTAVGGAGGSAAGP